MCIRNKVFIGLQVISAASLVGIVLSTGIVLFTQSPGINTETNINKILLGTVGPVLSAIVAYRNNSHSEITITHKFNSDNDKNQFRRVANMV